MTSLAQDIRSARTAVERVLDGVGLRAYVYAVKPGERAWVLRVEYLAPQGWQQVTLPVDPAELRVSLDDERVHDRLRASWGRHLHDLAARPVAH